jgi:Galactose oxidase, central domain/Kelch motif
MFGVVVMKGLGGLVAVVACAMVGVLLLAPPALAAGTWTATGSLTTPRIDHTATLLSNGKVLVAGGFVGTLPNPVLASAELYDPATGAWSATGSMVHARHLHTATLLQDGKVLVAGGSDASNTLASAELYDPAKGTWTATGNLNEARQDHTATLLPNGMDRKVLVAGGFLRASAELYDPAKGTATVTGNLNFARQDHTATLLPNGKVLVAGGSGPNLGVLASAELFDPATGSWRSTGSMTTARIGHTATVLESGNVLVAGGSDGEPNVLASAELYDPATGAWSATGSLNTARGFHTATLLRNHGGQVLVAGGFGGQQAFALASAEAYLPKTGTWTRQGSMITGRNSHTATFLPDGRVLVAGGTDSNNHLLASAELFSAPTALELAPSLVANSAGMGPGKALANKATAIQTAVNAGQTAHACTRIKDYLALVKAHTGKKLTTQQANDLATQATDLATELRC